MTKFTRRTMLVGTAAAAASVASVRAPAHAAAPVTGKQAPGFYRYKVGEYEITVVTDGARSFPLPDTFVNKSRSVKIPATRPSSVTITHPPSSFFIASIAWPKGVKRDTAT